MAVWQFDFHLVPRSSLPGIGGRMVGVLAREEVNEIDLWGTGYVFSQLGTKLDEIQPRQAPMGEGVTSWGSDAGDCIHVAHDGERVQDVLVRIDLRAPDSRFTGGILRVARDLDLVLVLSDLRVISPEASDLSAAIGLSDAAGFVRDPRTFLRTKGRH